MRRRSAVYHHHDVLCIVGLFLIHDGLAIFAHMLTCDIQYYFTRGYMYHTVQYVVSHLAATVSKR